MPRTLSFAEAFRVNAVTRGGSGGRVPGLRIYLFPPSLLLLRANLAAAQSGDPGALIPAGFRWVSPPNNPALQAAWIIGSEQKREPYILRVRLAAGGRIPPHTHPDERNSTVLAGPSLSASAKSSTKPKWSPCPPVPSTSPQRSFRTISGQGKPRRSIRKPASARRGHLLSASRRKYLG